MTELLTSAQMRAIEQAAIASGQVTGLELMERAGAGVVEAILTEWPAYRAAPQSVSILCGPGNNGGDGFVIARLLQDLGWRVVVWFYGDTGKLPPDARVNHDRWAALGDSLDLDETAFRRAPPTELYVDALLGTGLTRPVEGKLGEFLRHLAGSGGDYGYYQPRMVAVDVPSGLCADSGKVLGWPDPSPGTSAAPFARLTVTFETPKPGHFLADGPTLCGKLVVKDIGLQSARARRINFDTSRFEEPASQRPVLLSLCPALRDGPVERHNRFPPRVRPKFSGHKYSHGHVLVLTGGQGKTGAARLAARGALRIGAGLVTLGVPQNAVPEVAAQITGLMLTPVTTTDDLKQVLQDDRINVVCLGPGLGLDERAQALLELALSGVKARNRTIVLDADALTLLAKHQNPFAALAEHIVLTPHEGEFARLFPDISQRMTRVPRSGPAYSKVDAVRDAARVSGAVVLLKGPDTVVAGPKGSAWVSAAVYDRAAPWLATAGAGDVLAGFIAGLMARGHPPNHAAILAAQLHVDCARAFGPGLIAEDLPEMLPQVLRALGA